jgi:hypothetical protein
MRPQGMCQLTGKWAVVMGGAVVCDACSSKRIIVPRRSLTRATRACDECFTALSAAASRPASEATSPRKPIPTGPPLVKCVVCLTPDAHCGVPFHGTRSDRTPSGS